MLLTCLTFGPSSLLTYPAENVDLEHVESRTREECDRLTLCAMASELHVLTTNR